MSYDDETLEKLLANGHLSGASYDRIEERVMALTARRRPWVSARVLALAAAACGAGALLLLVGRGAPESGTSGFTEKGELGAAHSGSVELACSGEGQPCRAGGTLMFLVDSGVFSGYLSARAERLEPPSREHVWLFPTEGGDSPFVAAGEGMVVASQGVRLSGELSPGSYRVDVWFSRSKPLGHAGVPGEGAVSVRLKIEE
ncbi:MAG TPA: hypothetical protein VGK73_07385 [Polyangiaceae bacterium]